MNLYVCIGATPALSWFGVIGYSSASASPAIIISLIGPKLRKLTEEQKVFSTSDFGRLRYGRSMQLIITIVSIFYMFIYIVAELTSISNIYALITNDYSTGYIIGIALSVAMFTLFYTGLAGLPASIVTDKFQGIIMGCLVLVLTIAVTSFQENKVTKEEFANASNWTLDGFIALVTLFLAIASAEMFNQANWQRVWAAKDIPTMRKGFFLGSVGVFFLMMFFGLMGMLAYAKDPVSYDTFEKFSFLSFFDLLAALPVAWHILVLILVTALAASSIDSLQNALTCTFSADLLKMGFNPQVISRVFVFLLNIPAIALGVKGYNVISLFLVADLVCATSVLPVYLGLITEDVGFITAPTELGAFLGCVSGLVTVLVNGAIVGQGGFKYFWLQNGGICALCGTKTLVTFIVTPLISGLCTLIFSKIDVSMRGEKARKPLLGFCEGDGLTGSIVINKTIEKEEPQAASP